LLERVEQFLPARGIAGGLAGKKSDPEARLAMVPSTIPKTEDFIVSVHRRKIQIRRKYFANADLR
jgi:hypothetical protein